MAKTSCLITRMLLYSFFTTTAYGDCSSSVKITVSGCNPSSMTLNCKINCTGRHRIESVSWWWAPCSDTNKTLLCKEDNVLSTEYDESMTLSDVSSNHDGIYWCSGSPPANESSVVCSQFKNNVMERSCPNHQDVGGPDVVCNEKQSATFNSHCNTPASLTSPTPTQAAESHNVSVSVVVAFSACVFMICLLLVLMVGLVCAIRKWRKSITRCEVVHIGHHEGGSISSIEKTSFTMQKLDGVPVISGAREDSLTKDSLLVSQSSHTTVVNHLNTSPAEPQAPSDGKFAPFPFQTQAFSSGPSSGNNQLNSKQHHAYQNVPILLAGPAQRSPSHVDPDNEPISTHPSPPAAIEAAAKSSEHMYSTLEEPSGVCSSATHQDNTNFTRSADLSVATIQSPPATETITKSSEHMYSTLEETSGVCSSATHQDNANFTRSADLSAATIRSPPAAETTTKSSEHLYFTLEQTSGASSSTSHHNNANFTKNRDLHVATSQSSPGAETTAKADEHVYFTLEVKSGEEGSSSLHPGSSNIREITDLSNNSNHFYFTLEQPANTSADQQPSAPCTKSADRTSSAAGGSGRQCNHPHYPGDLHQGKMCETDQYDYAEIDEEPPATQEQRLSFGKVESAATASKRPARKSPKAVAFIPSQDSVLSPVLFCHLDPKENGKDPAISMAGRKESESESVTGRAANLYIAPEHDPDYAEVDYAEVD